MLEPQLLDGWPFYFQHPRSSPHCHYRGVAWRDNRHKRGVKLPIRQPGRCLRVGQRFAAHVT